MYTVIFCLHFHSFQLSFTLYFLLFFFFSPSLSLSLSLRPSFFLPPSPCSLLFFLPSLFFISLTLYCIYPLTPLFYISSFACFCSQSEYNQQQSHRLLSLARAEMQRQVVREQLEEVDSQVMDWLARFTVSNKIVTTLKPLSVSLSVCLSTIELPSAET